MSMDQQEQQIVKNNLKILEPIHPGEVLLEEFLEPMGITPYRLAREINVPAPRIYDVVRGKRAISADTALRLSRYFGTSERFWLNLQVRYDLEVEKGRAGEIPQPTYALTEETKTLVNFGGNTFSDFSVPLVFEGRYFIIEPGTPNPLVTVAVEHDGEPVFEVLKNEPQQNPLTEVSRTPVGIVTVGDRETGSFLYKVRPGSETSVTFGRLSGSEGEGLSVRITDRMVEVLNPDGSTMLTAQNNRFEGAMSGFLVASDGSVGIGAQIPPQVRSWLRGA